MTFWCHHCNKEQYRAGHQQLLHPSRGWQDACTLCITKSIIDDTPRRENQ